nr:zinc finger, C2H2 [Tanacetum cinerariifolium]
MGSGLVSGGGGGLEENWDKMVLGSGVGGDGEWFGVRRWGKFAEKMGISFDVSIMNKEVDNVVLRLDLTGSNHGGRLEKIPNYVGMVSLTARKQLWNVKTVILYRVSQDVVVQDLLRDALSARRVNDLVEDDDKKAKGVVVEQVCEPAPLVVEDGMKRVDNDMIFNGL